MKIKMMIGAAAAAGIALLGVGAVVATHTDYLHNPGICHIMPATWNEGADPYGDWVRYDMGEGYRIEATGGIGDRSDLAMHVQTAPHCSVDPVVWSAD